METNPGQHSSVNIPFKKNAISLNSKPSKETLKKGSKIWINFSISLLNSGITEKIREGISYFARKLNLFLLYNKESILSFVQNLNFQPILICFYDISNLESQIFALFSLAKLSNYITFNRSIIMNDEFIKHLILFVRSFSPDSYCSFLQNSSISPLDNAFTLFSLIVLDDKYRSYIFSQDIFKLLLDVSPLEMASLFLKKCFLSPVPEIFFSEIHQIIFKNIIFLSESSPIPNSHKIILGMLNFIIENQVQFPFSKEIVESIYHLTIPPISYQDEIAIQKYKLLNLFHISDEEILQSLIHDIPTILKTKFCTFAFSFLRQKFSTFNSQFDINDLITQLFEARSRSKNATLPYAIEKEIVLTYIMYASFSSVSYSMIELIAKFVDDKDCSQICYKFLIDFISSLSKEERLKITELLSDHISSFEDHGDSDNQIIGNLACQLLNLLEQRTEENIF